MGRGRRDDDSRRVDGLMRVGGARRGATGALSPAGLFARSSQRPPTPPPTSGEGLFAGGVLRAPQSIRRDGRSPPLPYGAGTRGCRLVVYGRGGRGVRAPRGPGGLDAVLPSPRGSLRGEGPGEGRCVRDARPEGRDPGAGRHSSIVPACAGGSAPLATVVSLPTARAARPGAQRRDTPTPCPSPLVLTTSSRPKGKENGAPAEAGAPFPFTGPDPFIQARSRGRAPGGDQKPYRRPSWIW